MNWTTRLDEILASTLVFGFLPILSLLSTTLNVPKDEIFILFDFVSSDINVSKKVQKIDENAAAFILQGAIDYLKN